MLKPNMFSKLFIDQKRSEAREGVGPAVTQGVEEKCINISIYWHIL